VVFILGLTGCVLSLTIKQMRILRAESSLLACDCELRNHLLPSASSLPVFNRLSSMGVPRISYVEDLNSTVWFGMTRRFRFAHAGVPSFLSFFPDDLDVQLLLSGLHP
jgi:hypothetical protein